MGLGEICFLFADRRTQSSDQRAWEIEQAKARSHAARISHRNKAFKRYEKRDRLLSDNFQLSRSVETGRLDPFVSLCMDLSVEDRNFLHGYFTTVPPDYYGTSPAASTLCPVRDVTLGLLSGNEILLSWAILFMHHQDSLLRGVDPNQSAPLLRRRQQTYRLMNDKLQNKLSAISEQVMYGLAFSALIEHRMGDEATAHKHLQACLTTRQLRIQKGLRVLSYPNGTLCIPIFIQVGVPGYFKSLEEIVSTGFNLRRLLCSVEELADAATKKSSTGHVPEKSLALWTGHELVQKQKTLLYQHLTGTLQGTSTVDVRLCLGLLTTISLAMLTFLQHQNCAVEFLQLLNRCFSESFLMSRSAQHSMPMLGMLITTFMCIDRIQTTTPSQPRARDLWQAVDMVEFLMLAAPISRVRVKSQLMSCLLDGVQGSSASKTCDQTFYYHVIKDVEAAWLSQQAQDACISQQSSGL